MYVRARACIHVCPCECACDVLYELGECAVLKWLCVCVCVCALFCIRVLSGDDSGHDRDCLMGEFHSRLLTLAARVCTTM